MATDWQPVSDAIGRIAGIANLSLYQNLRPPLPEEAVPLPLPLSCQHRIVNRSNEIASTSGRSRRDRFAIVTVVLGKLLSEMTIVFIGNDDSCFSAAPTLASVQMLPRDAGLRTTMMRRAALACGPISKLPATRRK
ncbi:dna polymerase epsilon subunit b [Lasius niger]|uniref:Dna polymerase epsilon subunit b n=1 Tax=Lasius niger TaxID=67767 RepID=A0A0J7KVC8_LASNI|nr:dna polymerase epsilon subunit b [Lasius niger]